MSDGSLWGEFLSSRDPTRIYLAMNITGDGKTVCILESDAKKCLHLQIVVFHPPAGTRVNEAEPPPFKPQTLEKYTVDDLPLKLDNK